MRKFSYIVIAILLVALCFNHWEKAKAQDDTPPIVVIEYPENGTIFNISKINVTGYAVDNVGIVKAEWIVYVENKSKKYSFTYPMAYKRVEFEFPIELFEGKNYIIVSMFDEEGNKGSAKAYAWYVYKNLTAIANGPYYGKVNEQIQFNGTAFLGTPPYQFHWYFGDGNKSNEEDPKHAYSKAGHYTVKFEVIDSMKNISVDYTEAIVYEELIAIANGPYEGMAGIPIQFYGNASGGIPPYQFHWYFGDGTFSNEQNPEHIFVSEGNYTVILTVKDSLGNVANDSTYVNVSPYDITPPLAIIMKPVNAIYIYDREIFPFPITIILGDITIEVNAYDNIGIKNVEFYVDNQLKYTDDSPPYSWKWDTTLGMHQIKVIAYDLVDNTGIDERSAWVWLS